MKYQTKSKIVDAAVYAFGMEDGWELHGTFYSNAGAVPRHLDRAPAVRTENGWRVVGDGDYIVTLPNGDKEVLSSREFAAKYEVAG